jgi:dihydrofolate reductase
MSLVFAQTTMSLDGFAAGPDDSPEHPLGVGGMALHEWMFSKEPSPADKEFSSGLLADTGAVVIGRRMADLGIPLWGPNGAFGVPTFIVTHRPATPVVRGPTTFTYVTAGLPSAIASARKAAQGKSVAIAGGATVIREALTLGLLDELRLTLAPILLGRGRSLFHDLDLPGKLFPVRAQHAPLATHLTYKVSR